MKRICLILIICLVFCGCTPQKQSQKTVFAMDTVMDLTVWGADSRQACDELEALFLQMQEEWNTQALNDGQWTVAQQEVLDRVLALQSRTEGAFDPQMYGVMQLWGFDTGKYRVPTPEELKNASPMWDLGGAVKGYAGDCAVELLEKRNVDCALLNLGGNVQTYGSKPDGTKWSVGIKDPDGQKDYVAVVQVEGTASIVTSGDYQRYFEKDGVRYHHIMDPVTGYPANSGVRSVTVISRDGLTADVLSTALFVMGLEKGSDFWRESDDFEAVFLLENGQIYATSGVCISGCDYEVISR